MSVFVCEDVFLNPVFTVTAGIEPPHYLVKDKEHEKKIEG